MTHNQPYKIPRAARWELVGILLVTLIFTALFWVTDLDIQAAAAFGVEQEGGTWTWPHENEAPWYFFYQAAPAMTGILGFTGLGMMIAGTIRPNRRAWRLQGFYLLMVVLFGPGLLVNAVFKDHWGRPRPRETIEFGGDRQHLPPLLPGEHGVGKSFPCGHCSVAFAYVAFWFLLRARKNPPRWRWLLLIGILALGTLVGMARMAAGAHFLSDVLWSGVISYLTAWVLFYPVMKLPWRLHAPRDALAQGRPRPVLVLAGYSVAGVGLLAGLLLATPLTQDLDYSREKAGDDPTVVRVTFDDALLTLRLIEQPAPVFALSGTVRGFGFPTNSIEVDRGYQKENDVPVVRYALEHRGIFTEYACRAQLTVSVANLREFSLHLGEGNLRIIGPEHLHNDPRLQLTVPNGEISWETEPNPQPASAPQ